MSCYGCQPLFLAAVEIAFEEEFVHVTQTHGRSLFLVLRKQPAEIKNSAVRHTFVTNGDGQIPGRPVPAGKHPN